MDFRFDEAQQAIADLAGQVLGDRSTHEQLRELENADGPRFDRGLWKDAGRTWACWAPASPRPTVEPGSASSRWAAFSRRPGETAAAVPLWETLALRRAARRRVRP